MATSANNVKGPFKKAELKKWRELLLLKRKEIFDDIGSLEHDAMDVEDGHIAPTHQADRGSDADLQDLSLRLADGEKEIIWQIDRALRKIETGQPLPFGLCEHSQTAISKRRLTVLPWTPISIEGAQYMEDHGLVLEDMLLDD